MIDTDFTIARQMAANVWNRTYANSDVLPNMSFAQLEYAVACVLMGEEPVVKKIFNGGRMLNKEQERIRKELFKKLAAIQIHPPVKTRTKTLKIFLRDGGCLDCGAKTDLTVDHIIPSSLGGGKSC